jgi:hypothetical protein
VELPNDFGARVRLFDTDGTDLGCAHVPGPVGLGDLIALPHGQPWRVVAVVELDDSALDAICKVEPAPPIERRSAQ